MARRPSTAVILLACAAAGGVLLAACSKAPSAGSYPLLSKRIFAEEVNDVIIDFQELRAAMRAYVASAEEPLAILFEYLPSGSSIGINEEERFIGASLLKVPIVMEAYYLAEQGVLDLDKTVRLEQADLDPGFGSLWKRGAGAELTLREAARLALQESDNTARAVIMRAITAHNPRSLDEIFDHLDLPKEFVGQDLVVSPEEYSSIFKSLYLASALTEEDSQAILLMLSRSVFPDKIPAGVPEGITVAHKVGIFESADGKKTYADCGIVYVPKRPYLLCMMLEGSEAKANLRMRELSRMAYEFVAHAKARNP